MSSREKSGLSHTSVRGRTMKFRNKRNQYAMKKIINHPRQCVLLIHVISAVKNLAEV